MPINIPVPALSLGYLDGLTLSNNATTPDEIVNVAQGQCRDSTGLYTLSLVNNATVSNVVSGINGLDTGTVAVSTLYSIYIIGDSQGRNATGLILSTSHTGSITFPSGYDIYRRLGSVRTDASSDNLLFKQTGTSRNRTMWIDSGTLGVTTTGFAIPSSATAASQALASIGVLTTLIPQSTLEVMIYSSLVANAAGDALMLAPYGFTGAVTMFRTNASGTVEGHVLRVPTGLNTVQEVYYATSSATATVAFTFCGYVDSL